MLPPTHFPDAPPITAWIYSTNSTGYRSVNILWLKNQRQSTIFDD
jgi:hypothetical protein